MLPCVTIDTISEASWAQTTVIMSIYRQLNTFVISKLFCSFHAYYRLDCPPEVEDLRSAGSHA